MAPQFYYHLPDREKIVHMSAVRIYYGWAILAIAALSMVGTLPGRTQGLGLVTEPLMLAGLSVPTDAELLDVLKRQAEWDES